MNKIKVLLTSTSFQDCEGSHKELLEENNWCVDYLRGPLKKTDLLNCIDKYDAIICGDDEIDAEVLKKGKNGKLKYISKYGIGLDKIDLEAAKSYNIKVANCKNVNQIAVAEHVIGLLVCYMKNIHLSYNLYWLSLDE